MAWVDPVLKTCMFKKTKIKETMAYLFDAVEVGTKWRNFWKLQVTSVREYIFK